MLLVSSSIRGYKKKKLSCPFDFDKSDAKLNGQMAKLMLAKNGIGSANYKLDWMHKFLFQDP